MSGVRIALCGNPNVGKSTVFNALTGLKQHTGNWTGKTVCSAVGRLHYGAKTWEIVDLPGVYSLLNGSPEEMITSDYLTCETPDAVVVVCDALCLERNLNLALQVAQICPKTLLCINMMDEATKRGLSIDLKKLEEMTGLPVCGISARNRKGFQEMLKRLEELLEDERLHVHPLGFAYPAQVAAVIETLQKALEVQMRMPSGRARFAALRLLTGENLSLNTQNDIQTLLVQKKKELEKLGFHREALVDMLLSESYHQAGILAENTVRRSGVKKGVQSDSIDRLLSRKRIGIPVMAAVLVGVLYITIVAANVPSEFLSRLLLSAEKPLEGFLRYLGVGSKGISLLVSGIYRVTSWIVSVMLPPMAIFFPLFTLIEDFGLLPRIAFQLDRCFQCCGACGKQALCMCMGLGCNAVGVTGTRIIRSKRERLIAILTNAMVPCNGRFPTLIVLIAIFFTGNGSFAAVGQSAFLTVLLVLSVVMSLLSSKLLSATLLKGESSSFALELPAFRRPKFSDVIVRSVLDRTLAVLGRTVCVAVPAGALVWLLANTTYNQMSILQFLAGKLDPLGKAIGMDGVMLLAFLLGSPANEIVLPIAFMTYMNQSSITGLEGFETIRLLLTENNWTAQTALCVMLFSIFHWPCSTTLLTIWKETKSIAWTLVSILLPTACGVLLCSLVRILFSL